MSWQLDTYRNKTTGRIVATEVIPVDDLKEHCSDEDCDCLPVVEMKEGAPMLIHNAFDGREYSEPKSRDRGQ